MSREFEGTSVLITGAGGGMGRAAALHFAERGAELGLADIDGDGLEETAGLARDRGADVLARRTDLSDMGECAAFVEASGSKLGRIDVVYNNAGVSSAGSVEELGETEWDLVHAVNVKSQYFMVRNALPLLRASAMGAVINVSSTAGVVGTAGMPVYSASKGAVISLTRALAVELAPDGIRVNCIVPGVVDTPLVGRYLEQIDAAEREEVRQSWVARQLLKRMGTADEVASAVLFLASKEAGFITGTVLAVDGGWTAS